MSLENAGKDQAVIDRNEEILTGTCPKCATIMKGPRKDWTVDDERYVHHTRCPSGGCTEWIMAKEPAKAKETAPEPPPPAPASPEVQIKTTEFAPPLTIPAGFIPPGASLTLTMKPACLDRDPEPIRPIEKPKPEEPGAFNGLTLRALRTMGHVEQVEAMRAAGMAETGIRNILDALATPVPDWVLESGNPASTHPDLTLPPNPGDGGRLNRAWKLLNDCLTGDALEKHGKEWVVLVRKWRDEFFESRRESCTVRDTAPDLPGDRHRLETAWGLMANAAGGNWNGKMTVNWVWSVQEWRDEYFASHGPAPAPKTLAGKIDAALKEDKAKREKPPLGLTPEWIWREHRLQAIKQAVERFSERGRDTPVEWWNEAAEHVDWIIAREGKLPEELEWAQRLHTKPAPPGYSLDKEHLRTGAKLLGAIYPVDQSTSREEAQAWRKNTEAWLSLTRSMIDETPAPEPGETIQGENDVPGNTLCPLPEAPVPEIPDCPPGGRGFFDYAAEVIVEAMNAGTQSPEWMIAARRWAYFTPYWGCVDPRLEEMSPAVAADAYAILRNISGKPAGDFPWQARCSRWFSAYFRILKEDGKPQPPALPPLPGPAKEPAPEGLLLMGEDGQLMRLTMTPEPSVSEVLVDALCKDRARVEELQEQAPKVNPQGEEQVFSHQPMADYIPLAADPMGQVFAYRTPEGKFFIHCPNCGAVEIPTDASPAPVPSQSEMKDEYIADRGGLEKIKEESPELVPFLQPEPQPEGSVTLGRPYTKEGPAHLTTWAEVEDAPHAKECHCPECWTRGWVYLAPTKDGQLKQVAGPPLNPPLDQHPDAEILMDSNCKLVHANDRHGNQIYPAPAQKETPVPEPSPALEESPPNLVPCPDCKGSGHQMVGYLGDSVGDCEHCDGDGRIEVKPSPAPAEEKPFPSDPEPVLDITDHPNNCQCPVCQF